MTGYLFQKTNAYQIVKNQKKVEKGTKKTLLLAYFCPIFFPSFKD